MLLLIALSWPPAAEAAADAASRLDIRLGEAIFRSGTLSSGRPLEGARDDGVAVSGAAAACAACHRRSGLGSAEGRILIPPIAGRYLFEAPDRGGRAAALPYVPGMKSDRPPYDDRTLARAIREGVDSRGVSLNYLMPRFELTDSDAAALIAYLRHLDVDEVPGLQEGAIRFATIVTPDADPVARQGMLDVLRQFVADKNAVVRARTPLLQASGKTMYSKAMYRSYRRWELSVWQLGGPASTWQAQLDRLQAAQPVYAVVSGLGGSEWGPVHAFCERTALPCLFPNVLAPPARAEKDFYSIYFSAGVALEAKLIGHELADRAGNGARPRSVVQIYRAGDAGRAGAAALAAELALARIRNEDIPIRGSDPAGALAAAMHRAAGADAVVLWLRPPDIQALGALPVPAGRVYASGLMGGLERTPLPAAWRTATHLSYPVDLPDARRYRVDYALGWLSIRHVPLVAMQVQVDTYIACGILSEVLSQMADAYAQDYLVERIQDMVEHRVVTGYYPRLTLGVGQRFASKGGYLAHFVDPAGARLAADEAWITP